MLTELSDDQRDILLVAINLEFTNSNDEAHKETLRQIHKHLIEDTTPLVGLSEAAQMLGWDKRKLSTYIKRGKFIEPIQRLASGPVWTKGQI